MSKSLKANGSYDDAWGEWVVRYSDQRVWTIPDMNEDTDRALISLLRDLADVQGSSKRIEVYRYGVIPGYRDIRTGKVR